MKISGRYTIDAPQDQVWAALNNIEVLARIVPGCERLEQIGDNEFEGTVKIGIQSIKGAYSGRIRIEDLQPPNHYKLVASGRSANGVVDGSGSVDLSEEAGKTTLAYSGDAQIGGVLASVGQRLIEGASKQLINQSLKALTAQIAQQSDGGLEAPAAPAASPSSSASAHPAPAAEPAAASIPAETPAPEATVRRTVHVPAHEQLKPEAVVRGVAADFLQEYPWLPWVIAAFLLGILIGRSRS